MAAIETLGELRKSGYTSRPVKQEIRDNLVRKLRAGDALFPGIIGYDETVIPQLVNAVLSRHNFILLGLRGQAKSRILRGLVDLLDDQIPVMPACEIHDDPLAPLCAACRARVAKEGDRLSIGWLPRESRYVEKLATPDVTIADMVGDIDPIKAAQAGLNLSNELTMHYGLLPRANRGIFAINELPDLAERIQVGLLNVLEERDVQVRGYKVRLPLDVMLVASANPEDYTNRGRIITPLKDRFGAQIRTHYPLEIDTEVAIAKQEVRPLDAPGIRVSVPEFMTQIVATLSHLARQSPHINQRSGVSVRLTVSNSETLVANALRRALRHGERDVVPRVSDLEALASSTAGKVEIEALEEGRDEQIIEHLLRAAVLSVFKDLVGTDAVREVIGAFDGGTVVHAGDDVLSTDEAKLVSDIPALRQPVSSLTGGDESPAAVASAVEFILEGLHLSKRLNKDAVGARAIYRSRG